jgi:hypothetical protein
MHFETAIDNSEYNPRHFEPIAANEMPRLKEIMTNFVENKVFDKRGIYGSDEPRIDAVGVELARELVSENPTEDDIAAMQRCVRFGLRLSMELSVRKLGYMAGLNSLEVVLKQGYTKRLVATSYHRYLSGMPAVYNAMGGVLRPLTNGVRGAAEEAGRNVISFVVEEADREIYVAEKTLHLHAEVPEVFKDHPEE